MHIGLLCFLILVMLLLAFPNILIDFGFWITHLFQDIWKEYKYEQRNKPLWKLKKGDTVYIFAYYDEFILGKVEAKMVLDEASGRYRYIVQDTKERKFVMNASRTSLTYSGSRYAFITTSKTEIIKKVYTELSRTRNKYQKRRYKDFMNQIASTL